MAKLYNCTMFNEIAVPANTCVQLIVNTGERGGFV